MGRVGEPDLSVLAASRRSSRVWGSVADDAALPASSQDLQIGAPDEEGGAGGSQRIQRNLPGMRNQRYVDFCCQVPSRCLYVQLCLKHLIGPPTGFHPAPHAHAGVCELRGSTVCRKAGEVQRPPDA